jgi:hypothetical protein
MLTWSYKLWLGQICSGNLISCVKERALMRKKRNLKGNGSIWAHSVSDSFNSSIYNETPDTSVKVHFNIIYSNLWSLKQKDCISTHTKKETHTKANMTPGKFLLIIENAKKNILSFLSCILFFFTALQHMTLLPDLTIHKT